MALSLTRLVTIVYITPNATITLIVSILDTMYVRDEIKRKKEAANSVPDGVVVVTENESKVDAGLPNVTQTSTLTAITVRITNAKYHLPVLEGSMQIHSLKEIFKFTL